MSVVVVATIIPVPAERDAVREALLATVPKVHEEVGCELYALHESDDGFVMIEQWSSAGDLDVHSRGENLAALGRALDGKVTGAPAVNLMNPLPVGDARAGRLA